MAATNAPWQRGYPLARLRRIARLFREAEEGLVHSVFGAFREREVAETLSRKSLHVLNWQRQPVAAVVAERAGQRRRIKDFRDQLCGMVEPGDLVIKRAVAKTGAGHSMLRDWIAKQVAVPARGAIWWEGWSECALDRWLLREFPWGLKGAKVSASSEIRFVAFLDEEPGIASGFWPDGKSHELDAESYPYPRQDLVTLCRLKLRVPKARLEALREALERRGPEFFQHYSSYNKGGAWTALALRGFGADSGFIIKPAEMAKKWKTENAGKLAWGCADTALRKELPEAEPLIDLVPGEKQRIRLMKLAPGGGELTRHADITDPEAGTAPGQLLRIHIPLVTNPEVIFRGWDLHGRQHACNMKCGEAWYLDTRKAHTARNGGGSERIHLVLDTCSSPELLALLGDDAGVV